MSIKKIQFTRLICHQAIAVAVGGGIVYFTVNSGAAKSLLYGGCITVASSWLLMSRYKKSGQIDDKPEKILRQAYQATIERFVWVIIMLLVGFKFIKLVPLWIIAGFVFGQGVWMLLPIWIKSRT